MRNKQWLRWGLLSTVVASAGFATFLVACGDDDDGGVVANKPDGSTGTDAQTGTDGAPKADTGTGDSSTPVDAGSPSKIQFINAATSLGAGADTVGGGGGFYGALRICYRIGETAAQTIIAPIPPLPDKKASATAPYSGVPIGFGGVAETTDTPLDKLVVIPLVMNAKSLATRGQGQRPDGGVGATCAELLTADAGGPMQENVDYWQFDPLPLGTFARESSKLLILTGCAADSTVTPVNCGADFTPTPGVPGKGNLKVTVYDLARPTVDANAIGTQFIHSSPSGALVLAPAGGVKPGYIDSADAGFKAIGENDGGTAVAYLAQTPHVAITGVVNTADRLSANQLTAVQATLTQIAQATTANPAATGAIYANGKSWTFIAVGEPGLAFSATDSRGFHFIGLPNDPTPVKYDPTK